MHFPLVEQAEPFEEILNGYMYFTQAFNGIRANNWG